MPADKNDMLQLTLERAHQLAREGSDWGRVWGKAWLERRIADWPSAWGDDLQILVYGDFDAPSRALRFPALGITVHAEKLENTIIRSAMCVLKATVEISERSVPAILHAVRRINVLLGAWALIEWGNIACGWWCHITHGSMGSVRTTPDYEHLAPAIDGVISLPDAVRQKVDAALYWVREPQHLLVDQYRRGLLRMYSAYWNAFECLVDAVLVLRPLPKPSPSEKEALITEFVAQRNAHLSSADIVKCYHDIVNPGFVGRARHALEVCFPGDAERYANECFRIADRANRLYDIRNAINHGDIDAENPDELLRVESRLHTLWRIVWRMFGCLVPFPAPVDNDAARGSFT